MNVADRIAEYVEGGVAKSLESICKDLGVDYESLSQAELEEIDSVVFICGACDWLLPLDCMRESEDEICLGCDE